MARIRHLAHAPIAEAVVDFRAALRPGFDPATFRDLQGQLVDKYPTVEDRRVFEAKVDFRHGQVAATHQVPGGLQGVNFKSADGRTIAQFRADGFTLNKLPPYSRWDDLRAEALRLWELYRALAAPEKLTRLGLRYINRIAVPPRGDLAGVLAVHPPKFPGTPKNISSFVLRISHHDPETGHFANVAQALEYSPGMDRADIILDIEAFTVTVQIDGAPATTGPALDQLRDMKNEIFFGSITEEAAARFE